MKKKLLIFDLDGTILNTLEDLADSVNFALAANQLPERTLQEIRRFLGNGVRKLVERSLPEGCDEAVGNKVFDKFREYYKEHCADKTRPYEGISELLDSLQDKGYYLAVVSNKADFAVKELCETYFPKKFEYAVGEREGIRRKPYPDSVLEVLDKLHIKKEHAIYVGDSEVDIQTAKNAGIEMICVKWGFRDVEYLLEQGAEKMVAYPNEILEILYES